MKSPETRLTERLAAAVTAPRTEGMPMMPEMAGHAADGFQTPADSASDAHFRVRNLQEVANSLVLPTTLGVQIRLTLCEPLGKMVSTGS